MQPFMKRANKALTTLLTAVLLASSFMYTPVTLAQGGGPQPGVPATNQYEEVRAKKDAVRDAALARLTPVSPNEVVGLRAANQRVFRNDDGSYRVEMFPLPVHFQNEEGLYEPIDNTIVPESKNGFALRNKGNLFSARFGDTPGSQKMQIEWMGKRITLGLDESEGALRTSHSGKEVRYGAGNTAYQYRYEVGQQKVKEEIILNRFTGKTTWQFPLEIEGLIPATGEGGQILFMRPDAINEVGASIDAAFAVDASGARTDNLTQQLVEENGKYRVELTVPQSWLASPDRVYPVTIDPTVSLILAGLDSGMWAQIKSGVTSPNGAVDDLYIRSDSSNNLLKFDLSKIRWQLDADTGKPMQLTSATLKMKINETLTVQPYCTQVSNDQISCAGDMYAEPLARDWIMDQVTWTQPRWNNTGNLAEQNWIAGGEVCTAETCPELPPEALQWVDPQNAFQPYHQIYDVMGDPYEIPLTPLVQRWLDGFPNYGVRLRLTNLPGVSGLHAWFAVDATQLVLNFQIDQTKPSVSITSPTQESRQTGNVTVQVTAADKLDNLADGVLSRIHLLVDGNFAASVPANKEGSYSLTTDLSGYAAGRHRLTARAYDLAGNYQDSSISVLLTDGVVAPATNLRVVPSSPTTYSLSWAAARPSTLDGVTPPAVTYVVERATDDHFTSPVTVGSTTALSITDTTPTAGTYYWRVRSTTPNSVAQLSAGVASRAPLSPAHLIATPGPNGQIQLVWPASPTAADDPGLTYQVYRNGAVVSPSGLQEVTWTDTVSPGLSYSYEVAAVDRAGRVSATSAAVTAAATGNAGPAAPKDFRAYSEQNNRIALAWTPSASETAGYNIYRSTDQQNWTLLTPAPIGAWFYLDGGLAEGTTYYYQVETVDGGLTGPRTGTVGAMAAPTRRLGVDERWTMLPVQGAAGAGYVNIQSGNLALSATDAVLPGPVFANVLRRTYNSQGCLACSALGGGWRLNAEWRLDRQESYITVTEGDGSEMRFKPGTTAGSWIPDEARYFWTLTEESDGSYTLSQPDETRFRFDSAGRLTRIEERSGNALAYTYDAAGRLNQVTNSANRTFTFQYDANDRLIGVGFATGRLVGYGYDDAGRLSSVTDPDGFVTGYAYDAEGRLSRVTDPAGRWLSMAYDEIGRLSSWTDGVGNRFRLSYDGVGRTALYDPQGAQTQFEFNTFGWLTKLVDPLQSTWSISYTPTTITSTNPRGLAATVRYDERGNVTEVEEVGVDLVAPGVNSRLTRYYYGGREGTNNAGLNDLYKVVDPEGNETATFYTTTGPKRVEKVVDAEGGTTLYGYDSTNPAMIKTITDPNNNLKTFNYTAEWDLQSIVYDVFNPVTQTTTQLQQRFEYQDGMPVSQSEMHAVGGANPPVVRTEYDKSGRILRVSYPDGSQEVPLMDASGNISVVIDRGGMRTASATDAAGRLVAQITPDGGVTRYTYTGLNATKIEAPDGLVTEHAYDMLSRAVATKNPDQTVQRVKYDEVGNAVAVLSGPAELFSNPDSAKAYKVTASYYLTNLPREMSEPLPTTAILAASGVTGSPGCAGTGTDCNRQTYTYNKNGQKVSFTDGNGYRSVYAYDRAGRLTSAKDARNIGAEYVYDKGGSLKELYKPGYPMWKEYDGQLSKTNPEKYDYDGLNRKVRVSTTDNGIYHDTIYAYNEAGDLIEERKPAYSGPLSTYYQYNASHQVERISYTRTDVTPEVRFVADAGGRRLLRSDVYGNTWYRYDQMGRSVEIRGLADQVEYEYDAAGRRTAMTFNLGRVDYTYSQGRLTEIGDPLGNKSTFGYDEYGHNTSISLPKATLTNTYYRLPNTGPVTNRLQQRSWKASDGSVLWSGTYRTDHVGNVRENKVVWHSSIATSTNKLPSSQTLTFTYDQAYRLTAWNDSSPYKSPNDYWYEYNDAGDRTNSGNVRDAAGNLRWKTPAGTTVSLEREYNWWDSHESYVHQAFSPNYEQVGPEVGTYGEKSNVAYTQTGSLSEEIYFKDGSTSATVPWDYLVQYDYDDADRLVASDFEPHTDGCRGYFRRFKYDGDGRMIDAWSYVAGGCGIVDRSTYSYDGSAVIQESGSNGKNLVWYITLPGSPTPLYSLRIRGRDLKPDTHVTDHLGSTVEVVDYTGKISNHYAYDPFGGIEGSSSELLNSYTFTSSVQDHATGLYFMGARVYNSNTGRFLTQDTYRGSPWQPWTQNLYTYVGNNPVNFVDPTGHWPEPLDNWFFGMEMQFRMAMAQLTLGFNALDLLDDAGIPADNLGITDLIDVEQSAKKVWDILPFKDLARGTGLHRHHLIEKRFARQLGIDSDKIPSVLLDPDFHNGKNGITQQLLAELKTGEEHSKEEIWAAYQKVYSEYPEWLEAIRPYFE